MRVLLVYANRAKDLDPAPPIGLAYVASATRRAGHLVRFVDVPPGGSPRHALERTLERFAPDVVGISVRNIDNAVCQRFESHWEALGGLIALVRERSRAAVVLGGPAVINAMRTYAASPTLGGS